MPVATMSYNQDLHHAHASSGSLRSQRAQSSSYSPSKSTHSPTTPTTSNGTSATASPTDYHHAQNQGYPNLPPPAREFLINVEMWVPSSGGKSSAKIKSKTRSRPSSTIFSPVSSTSRANVSGASSHDDLSLALAHSVSSPTTSSKTSIFSSTSGGDAFAPSEAGIWKPAVCKLSGEGGPGVAGGAGAAPTGSALLTIYSSDDNTLQHVINVHKLTSTDVRPCDKSLFNRPDVLAVWGHPAAVSLSTAPSSHSHSSLSSSTLLSPAAAQAAVGSFAPIYLSFTSQEAHNTWLVLLRSYTSPEVYGRLIHPEQGGLYRMWRQVEVVVVQTRGVDPNPASAASSVAAVRREAAAASSGAKKADSRPGTATAASEAGGGGGGLPLTLTNSHTPSVGTSITTSSGATSQAQGQQGTSASGGSPTTPTTIASTSLKSWSTSSLPASMDSESNPPNSNSNHPHHPYNKDKTREKERKEREKREKEKEKERKDREKERREREKKEMKRLAAHARHGFFAEIVLDGEVCGRTAVKRPPIPEAGVKPPSSGSGTSDLPSPEWFENFLFGDLPSFGNLLVMLWRAPDKKEKDKEREDRPRSRGVGSAASESTAGIGTGSSMSLGTSSIATGTTSATYATMSNGLGVTPNGAFGGAKGAVFLGCVEIALPNFRRGEWVEGWWPVYHHANLMSGGASASNAAAHGASSFSGLGMGAGAMGLGGMSGVGGVAGALVQIGEMKLKIKVDEEIILPSKAYKNVLDALEQRNYLDVLSELEQKLRIDHSMIAPHIVSLAVARNRLLKDIIQLAEREVAALSGSTNTLFRGNTVLTKTMELAMAWYGRSFLDASVGPIIRRMIKENVEIEVDPSHLRYASAPPSSKRPSTRDSFRPSTRDSYRPGTAGSMMDDPRTDGMLENGMRLLEYWCNELWNQMYVVRMDCPVELRRLFGHIRIMVERKFNAGSAAGIADPTVFGMLPRQAISSFVFLRFIVPAILRPHLFGLCPGMPTGGVGRSLTLLAKCTQTLANLNPDAPPKEDYMRGIGQCIKNNTVTMIDYLACVSSLPDQFSSSANTSSFLSGPDKHDRLHVIHSLRERLTGAGNNIPTLYKDAIPLLPYALDVPKHLAILSSSVVRNARSGTGVAYGRGGTAGSNNEMDGWTLGRFSELCFDVEAQALKSVATLAQGAASAAAFNGHRMNRSTSVSSTGGLQNAGLSVVTGSRGVTPTSGSATTPTQTTQSPWTTQMRRPGSSRSITTPTGPPSAGATNPASASPVSKPSHTTALPASPMKKKSNVRPSTAPSATTVTHTSNDDLYREPRMRTAAPAPDLSPAGAFRYLPPEQDQAGQEPPSPQQRAPYGQYPTPPSPGYQTIHRAESESFVAFHYPTASSRFQTSNEALKVAGDRSERRSSRIRDFMKRPSTSSGAVSSQRPKWGEHSSHSSSGEELAAGGSLPRNAVGSAGSGSGEGYAAGKRADAGEPKKKRKFFGWLGGKK